MQKIAWDITWDNLGAKDLFSGGSQAQSGHSIMSHLMSLSGVKRTYPFALHMSDLTQSGHRAVLTAILYARAGTSRYDDPF
jgi:hypothetical protein